jgi:hypothetical protein
LKHLSALAPLLPRPGITGSLIHLDVPNVALTAQIAAYAIGDQRPYRLVAKFQDELRTGIALAKQPELTGKI